MQPHDLAWAHGACLVIDLQALEHNWQAVRAACPHSCVGAVVKNDAYGLGVARVVPRLWQLGCRDFWVSSVDEALAVQACLAADARQRGLRLWLLNGLADVPARELAAQGLIPALTGAHELAALHRGALPGGDRLPVALHLDTGLTRVGFGAHELEPLGASAALWQVARPQLWLTHLGRFHDPDAAQCQQQRARFLQWTGRLPAAARSIATSSSVFAGACWHFEHVRVGSALWGVPTSARAGAQLQPVAHLHAPVLRVAEVAAGTEVGYGGGYVAERACRIATVALGYGDGLPFTLASQGAMVLAGRAAPIVGGVAMGMVALDVSGHAPGQVQAGMWAEVYGRQQPLAQLAAAAGVAPNVLLSLSARLAPQRRVLEAAAP